MKRYLLFSGQNYYPSSGTGDYVGSFPSLDDALNSIVSSINDWYEVVYIENDGTLRTAERGKIEFYYDYDTEKYKIELAPFLD